MQHLLPLERFLRYLEPFLGHRPGALEVLGSAAAVLLLLFGVVWFFFPKYVSLVSKSLRRNILRTVLASLAIMVLVFVVTLIWSFLVPLDIAMTEQTSNLKTIVSERWQVPSQMPPSYASTLEEGGYSRPGDLRILREDAMTWSFYGGTLDKEKRTFENIIFFFVLDPQNLIPRTVRVNGEEKTIPPMMDDLDHPEPQFVEAVHKMMEKRNGVIIGQRRLEKMNKRVGERFVVSSFNFIDLDFEIVGTFPKSARYDQSAVMNRDYLSDALDKYKRENGKAHPMAEKALALVWLRVPDSDTFSKLSNQIMSSPLYTSPALKAETASSGISTFLEPYRDILWGVKWILVPALLIIMALVMAMAISINVRERRTEMAVLKVLGFTPARIQALVLGEALVIGAASGLLSAAISYGLIHGLLGGIPFQIAFFAVFDIFADALWWGVLFGAVTTFLGSIIPAWSARTVKVSEVFAKIA
jgi:putative ABC transport system permease protein